VEDAPFVGALISAIDCWENCDGCFNQHLKELPTQEATAKEIIALVKSNPINEGIILSGLEWTLQPAEMFELLSEAKMSRLKTMLHTDMSGNEFKRWFDMYAAINYIPSQYTQVGNQRCADIRMYLDYIKFGCYELLKLSENYYSNGIKLASTNQHIKELTR
jgi:organic radical activating enzyme